MGTNERMDAPKYATSALPKAPPAVETEKVRLHAVQKGDTLFEIAAKYYGSGHLWQELAKFNGIKEKDGAVRIGMRLKIPSKDTLLGRVASGGSKAAANAPAGKPQPKKPETLRSVRTELASYTVKRGESLGFIAQKTLGSAKRWPEIADLNKIEDEDHVPAGTVLKIPADGRG
jgi:nucleoid-associated protein YgaU